MEKYEHVQPISFQFNEQNDLFDVSVGSFPSHGVMASNTD